MLVGLPKPSAFAQSATYQAYGHSARVFDVRFSPVDANIFASGSDDTTARVWIIDGERVRQLACCYGHSAEVLRLAWSKDGNLLATGSADGSVRVWEPLRSSQASYDGHLVAVLAGHPEEVYHVEFLDAIDPSGSAQQHLLVASSESLFVWDVGRQEMLQKADAPGTSGSTLTTEELISQGGTGAYVFGCTRQPACAGGRLVACACSDGALRLWALGPDNRLSFLHAAPLGSSMLTTCAFDSRGAWLACAARDGTVHVLDARTFVTIRTLRVPYVAFCCCFVRREGVEWLALSGAKGQLTLIDVQHPGTAPVCMAAGADYAASLLTVSVSEGGEMMAAAGDAQDMAPVPVPVQGARPGGFRPAAGQRQGSAAPGGQEEQGAELRAHVNHAGAAACADTGTEAAAAANGTRNGGSGATASGAGADGAAADAGGPLAAGAAAPSGGLAAAVRAAAGAAARRRGRPKPPPAREPPCAAAPVDARAVTDDDGGRLSALDAEPFGATADDGAGASAVGRSGGGGTQRGPGGREERPEECVVGVTVRAPIFVWRL